MADINITVTSPDTFTITLDVWEWTGLTVNGAAVSPYSGPNPNIQFQYTGLGPINFIATATQDIDIVNPGNIMVLAGPDEDHSYFGIISYAKTDDPPMVTLKGHLNAYGYLPDSLPSPITFSQGRMTGTFQTA